MTPTQDARSKLIDALMGEEPPPLGRYALPHAPGSEVQETTREPMPTVHTAMEEVMQAQFRPMAELTRSAFDEVAGQLARLSEALEQAERTAEARHREWLGLCEPSPAPVVPKGLSAQQLRRVWRRALMFTALLWALLIGIGYVASDTWQPPRLQPLGALLQQPGR